MPPTKGVRQGGGFAKRTANSSKLSRKIGWLNGHANLQDEIRFVEVKDLLQKIGEDEAMKILQNLENKAKQIQNPTGYIVNSARNSMDGSRRPQRSRRQGGKGGHRNTPVPEPDEPPKDWKEHGEEPQDFSNEAADEAMDGPADPPTEPESEDPYAEQDAAMESKAEVEPGDAQQLEDQMRTLNSGGALSQDLDIDQLLEPLTHLETSKGMEILARLEEKATEVKNPTAYVMSAVRRQGGGKSKGRGKGGEDRREKGVIKNHLKEKQHFDPALVEKVKKRISWLNDKANLNDTLSYEKVGEILLSSGPIAEVMKILKLLEESASEVRNPNGYIVTAARRLQKEGVAPEPKGSKKQDYRDQPLHEQLRAHIAWLNREVALNAALDYDRVSQSLLSIDTQDAGEILRRLEESAKEVRDPNGYVIRGAQRILDGDRRQEERGGKGERPAKGGGKGERREVPEPPPRPLANAEDEKIAKRVNWLNANTHLASPLDYDRLASSFRSLGYYQSLEILNNLEEHASSVKNPTAYVMAGIKKMMDGSGARTSAPALPAPPAKGGRGKGGGEAQLRRNIEWLNDSVCRGSYLDLDKVLSALMSLQSQQAFDVLKNFEENASSVRDPTAYVIGTARKAERGENIGTAPSRKAQHYESSQTRAPPRSKGEGRPSEPIGSFGGGRPSRAPMTHSTVSTPDARIRKQVKWLNKNAGLQYNLDEDRIVQQLMKVGDKDAMEILKRLEESASTVRDPTAYVISALRRNGKGRTGK